MQVDLSRDEILLLISCTTYAAEQWARYQIEGAAAPCLKRFDNLTEKLQHAAKFERIECPDCGRDWGHSFCGTCQGKGTIIREVFPNPSQPATNNPVDVLPPSPLHKDLGS